jgi:hypothetical protein
LLGLHLPPPCFQRGYLRFTEVHEPRQLPLGEAALNAKVLQVCPEAFPK